MRQGFFSCDFLLANEIHHSKRCGEAKIHSGTFSDFFQTNQRFGIATRHSEPNPDPSMIEVENLHKHFGAKVAVDGVSFTVKKGEVLGFLGPERSRENLPL